MKSRATTRTALCQYSLLPSLPLCVAVHAFLFSPISIAQQGTDTVETIVVTGSRSVERSIMESPVPIDVFSANNVRESGAMAGELGEALSTLVPSFNFLRQSNSGTSDHVRAGQLRSMSPDQMLVLINGKRRHTSAVVNSETKIGRGTAAVDFNTIPVNAVNHIEVLRDGAGAQYGSDAMSGVVNIMLDRETVRPQFNVGYGLHNTDFEAIDERITDGRTVTLDGKTGWSLQDSGFLNAGFDLKRRDATDRGGFDQIPFFVPQTPANLALRGQRNYVMGDPDVEDINLWLNSERQFGQNILYAFATYGERDTEGATFFRYPNESANVPAVYPQGYRPVSTGENRDHSITGGLSVRLGAWSADNSVTIGGNRFRYGARNSLNASFGAASPTSFHSGEYQLDQLTVNSDLVRATPYETAFGTLHVAAGAEYRKERFRTQAGDTASWQAGPFDGSIGAQGAMGLTPADEARENRDVWSLYLNVADQVTDRLLIDTAARYERYSDVGNELTGKAAFYYEVTENAGLRGALSNSLRAPALSQTGFSDRTTNFGDNRSLVNTVTLPVESPIAVSLGANGLKAETSRNASLGLAVQLTPSVSASLDAFSIDVDDRITLSDRLFGQALVDFVQPQPGGAGIESVRFFTNAIDTQTRGVDLILSHEGRLLNGSLSLVLGYSHAKTEISRIAMTPDRLAAIDRSFRLIGAEEINTIEEAAPRQKASLLTRWERDNWTVLNRVHYYGSVVRVFNFGGGFEPRQRYDAEVAVDLEGSYSFNDTLSLSLGVNNMFDNYPDRSSADINYFGNLPHDVLSPIGVNGRYVFTAVTVRL